MKNNFNSTRLLTIALAALLVSSVSFAGQSNFLSPRKAFPLTVQSTKGALQVRFSIAPGYALYRKRMTISLVKVHNMQLGKTAWPKPIVVENPFSGKELMYRGKINIRIPFVCAVNGMHEVQLKIRFQGCADAGLCYPPVEKKVHMSVNAQSC